MHAYLTAGPLEELKKVPNLFKVATKSPEAKHFVLFSDYDQRFIEDSLTREGAKLEDLMELENYLGPKKSQ